MIIDHINSVIKQKFVNLNISDVKFISLHVSNILDLIIARFNIINKETFIIQIKKNNNRDIFAIVNMLLPYINENKYKLIRNLEEIYTLKQDNNYVLSNMQYNRCFRSDNNITEVTFLKEYFMNNYELLRETIHLISNKLYINWINVRPILLSEYKEDPLYLNTKKYGYENDSSLYIGDVYNTLTHYFYLNVKKQKWLLYYFSGKMSLQLINEYISIEKIIDNEEIYIDFEINFQKFIKNSDILLVTYLYIFYESNYKNHQNLHDKYILEKEDKEIDILEKDIESLNVIENLNKIPINNIYDFLRDSIIKIKKSCYNYYIFDNNKLKDNLLIAEQDNFNVKIKDIYNFAKSLCHDSDFNILNKFYQSLTLDNKNLIKKRLSDDNTWFNIKSNIKRQNTTLSNQEISDFNDYILDKIKNILTDIIFVSLIEQGILTKLYFDRITEDKTTVHGNLKSIINRYSQSKYYLTNDTYENLYKLRVFNNNTNKYDDLSYFDVLTKNHYWYSFYGMNLFTQINFFHKYINNRVLFVTGGTGVGKSTQTPKLLLYALKMIDYKTNGKVAMTQPRTGPTINNSARISEELGVPVIQYSRTQNDQINTKNYYVQYKFKTDSHVSKHDMSYLKLITDGTLFMELNNNILLRNKNKNIYDIVAIDESHEHNSNMDLLLTLIRNTLYYNNTIRLVIISATMEDDEPIYRRYYRDINDNLLYPYHSILKEKNLDRINVDRRIHIAIPGETNIYDIKEYYFKTEDTYDSNEKKAIQVISDISKKSMLGDVLVFSTGKEKINKLCQKINAITPSHIIAIPHYSEMPHKWKYIIENLHKEKQNIDVSKEDLFKAIDNKMYNKTKIRYKNVIIIATNVAEASLTIASLYYVVDLGFVNVVAYNILNNLIEPKLVPISENSRIQRKGRVGRVNNGICYFCYPEESRKNNRDYYSISTNNISTYVYNLLYSSYQDTILFDKDPLKTDLFKEQLLSENITELYYGNKKHSQYLELPNYVYKTGFELDNVLDFEGKFYIIHPDELFIERDKLTGKIIKSLDKDLKMIEIKDIYISNRMIKYVELLINSTMIYNYDFSYYQNEILNKYKVNFQIEKGNISKHINGLTTKFNLSYNDLLAYYYSTLYDCSEEYIIILSLSRDLQNKEKQFKHFATDLNKFFKLFKGNNSDYMIYINLFTKFKQKFKNLKIFQNIERKESQLYQIYLDIKLKIKNKEINPYDIPKTLDIKSYKYFEKKGEDTIYDIVDLYAEIEEDIYKHQSLIYNFCENNYINYIELREGLKRYFLINSTIQKNKHLLNLKDKLIIPDLDKTNVKEDNIIKTMLRKDFQNIGFKKDKLFDLKSEVVLQTNNKLSSIQPSNYFMYHNRDKRNIHYISNIKLQTIINNMPHILTNLNQLIKPEIIKNLNVRNINYLLQSKDPQFVKFYTIVIKYLETL